MTKMKLAGGSHAGKYTGLWVYCAQKELQVSVPKNKTDSVEFKRLRQFDSVEKGGVRILLAKGSGFPLAFSDNNGQIIQ